MSFDFGPLKGKEVNGPLGPHNLVRNFWIKPVKSNLLKTRAKLSIFLALRISGDLSHA